MMKKLLFLILFLLLSPITRAITVEIDSICYNINLKTGEVEVTSNTNHVYADTIVIPEKIVYEGMEYEVTAIGKQAFFCCEKVRSVIFPNSITSIGKSAFWGCHGIDSIALPDKITEVEENLFADCEGLRRVVIPEGVTRIGGSAFNSCICLDSLVLPQAVESIESWTFAGCKSLSHIEMPKKLREVGRGCFGNCPSLVSVLIPDLASWCRIYFADPTANPLCTFGKLIIDGEEITNLVIPEDVTSIGNYTFSSCGNIDSLTIGEKVTSIGSAAFSGCSKLTSVVCLPRKVPSTGSNAFNNSALENCTLYVAGSAVSAYAQKEPWSNFKEIIALEIPKHQLFYYLDGELYKSYTLEEGEYITPEPPIEKEGYTFSGWSEIPETMPAHDVIVTGSFTLTHHSLTFAGINYTLWMKTQTADVSGMLSDEISEQLTIPSVVPFDGTDYEVTGIADSAFYGCSRLVSVTIPENITYIGKEAFNGCMLQNVFIKNMYVQLESTSFSQASYNHAMLYIPSGKWSEAVYYGNLWRFINIRETATEIDELSNAQAYTLMDANTFSYVVYDAVNDVVKSLDSFYKVEESSPNNSWQLVDMDGKYCLYNIGAKKYAMLNNEGKISLVETATALDLEDGKNGIVFGDKTTLWNFVLNDKVSIDQDPTSINNMVGDTPQAVSSYYMLNGMKTITPRNGTVTIQMKDGKAKKIIHPW